MVAYKLVVGLEFFYAFLDKSKTDASNAVIIVIVLVCHHSTSILFNLGSTYSYVSTCFASDIHIMCE